MDILGYSSNRSVQRSSRLDSPWFYWDIFVLQSCHFSEYSYKLPDSQKQFLVISAETTNQNTPISFRIKDATLFSLQPQRPRFSEPQSIAVASSPYLHDEM